MYKMSAKFYPKSLNTETTSDCAVGLLYTIIDLLLRIFKV